MEGGKRGLGVCWTETVRRKLSCIFPIISFINIDHVVQTLRQGYCFLNFTIISIANTHLGDKDVQTLSQGRCFPDQQGRRWQRSRQQRGKEHSSTSSTEQQKVSSILSMIYLCDHHKLWWSIMIVSGHLSAFQVLEPFQSSYLGLPALDFC